MTKTRKPTMVYGVLTEPRVIVACASVAEAGRLIRDQYSIGYTDYYIKNYGCETGNDAELAAAYALPGTVLIVDGGRYDARKQTFFAPATGKRYETYLALRETA
jgi:hypothetical protein